MTFIDIILAIALGFGLVRGFMKGLFVELASLIAIVAGIFGAIHFSYIVGNYLAEAVEWNEQYVQLTSFAITFIIIIFVVSLAGKMLTKLASFAALGILNRILGGAFGVVKMAFISSAVLMVVDYLNTSNALIDEETMEDSMLYKPVQQVAPLVLPTLLEKFDRNRNDSAETAS
ncbi:CvpA family protein [Gangjinia marincola]|uniref:CvpA family protein n=1 Tax=Gangjinia marincola TaxID=578463 RepID=A0ABP3XYP4_9FLAO